MHLNDVTFYDGKVSLLISILFSGLKCIPFSRENSGIYPNNNFQRFNDYNFNKKFKSRVHPSVQIDSSAIVDEGAKIGANTKIWHWVHICSKAVIGKNCSFGQNVFVANNVTIGDNVKVQNNVSIYENVSLENDVFCGPSMVFTNVINPRSKIERKTEYKKTQIKKDCFQVSI